MKSDSNPTAEEFARWAHAGQKYGDHPYSVHLEEVVSIIRSLFLGSERLALLETVGWLHDILEDTYVIPTQLELFFDSGVAFAVIMMTDSDEKDRSKRKAQANSVLKGLDENNPALIVKVADRLANVRFSLRGLNETMLKLYSEEYPAFREAAYRSGLCDPWWKELDLILTNVDGLTFPTDNQEKA